MPTSIRVVVASFALSLSLAIPVVRAAEPVAPDQQKKLDAAAGPVLPDPKGANLPTEVTESARPVLNKMRDAYGKLAGLQTSGTWTVEWDVDGEAGKTAAEFTSSYATPNKFRHETKDDLLFGSTGEKVYAFTKNQYLMNDAPKARTGVADLPKAFADMLKEKNPSLLLAATDDDTPFLAERTAKIDKGEDVKLGDVAYTSLLVVTDQGANVTVLVDSSTGLMRQWSVDLKKTLEERGQQNVKKATMTIDYAKVDPAAPSAADAFAWVPPSGAKDAARMAEGGDDDSPAQELVGKPAPAFELEDLDGKKVKLADLKGSVVVLDFWATWCGPCRKGLPILDKVAEARKDKKELKVYAVNIEEDKATVEAFKKDSKLGLPVLLDASGDTGRAYKANAIPLTIIIGKDGSVKHALLGVHEQAELEKVIDEAMGK